MFGFKIISEKKFYELKEIAEYRMVDRENVRKAVETLRKEDNSLREQLDEKSKETTFKELKNLYIIRDNSYPCKSCKLESEDCTKLTFADRTICVCPKDKVNSFRPKNANSKTNKS